MCFWKEEPQLHYGFDLVESSEVFVVPVFMSEGYFTDRVVPRELGLEGRVTARDGRTIHYCPLVGTHPRMAEIVLDRAAEVRPPGWGSAADVTLVVLGHGTERHPRSAATTVAIAETLRRGRRFARVLPAFLDQEPYLDRVLAEDARGSVVVVPFFVSEGWHVGSTIEGDLERKSGPARDPAAEIRYAKPVGTHPKMAQVVQDIIARESEDAGDAIDARRVDAAKVQPPAAEAKQAFLSWIRGASGAPRRFLQTVVSWTEVGGFEIRHAGDRDAPADALRALRSPHDALWVAAKTAEGGYRPLKTAPDLQSGWRFSGLSGDDAWSVFEYLYPAAPLHQYLHRVDQLSITPFQEAAKRQTGLYEGVEELSGEALEALVADRCSGGRCLRDPTWAAKGAPDEGSRASGAAEADVPCPAPCSVFLSAAVEVLAKTK